MTPRRSMILDVALDVVCRTGLLLALFLLFAGHNAPGGGFVAGLVAGTTLVLRYVAGGAPRVDHMISLGGQTLLGAGLLLAVLTGVSGWFLGDAFLYGAKVETEVPVLGTLKATSALAFDIGVALVVVGLVLALLRSLGATADRDLDADDGGDDVPAGTSTGPAPGVGR